MEQADWRLKGEWIKNCNCAFGCPCDFNARPTNGECKGLVAMHVAKGHFGEVSLDGLNFAAVVDFPGPLHEGNGTLQAIIDERASPAQRDALLAILSGKNSAEGTIFHIFSLIVSKRCSRSSPRSRLTSTCPDGAKSYRSPACWRPRTSRSATR